MSVHSCTLLFCFLIVVVVHTVNRMNKRRHQRDKTNSSSSRGGSMRYMPAAGMSPADDMEYLQFKTLMNSLARANAHNRHHHQQHQPVPLIPPPPTSGGWVTFFSSFVREQTLFSSISDPLALFVRKLMDCVCSNIN